MLANLILSFICVKKVKEMTEDRSWMYEGRVVNGKISVDWVNMVGQRFIQFALQHRECMSGEMIKCPCKLVKCQNKSYREVETVKEHLAKKGFVPNYTVWTFHGELEPRVYNFIPPIDVNVEGFQNENVNAYQRMLMDAAGSELY